MIHTQTHYSQFYSCKSILSLPQVSMRTPQFFDYVVPKHKPSKFFT